MASTTSAKAGKAKSNEEIFAGFQTLRNEQRMLANKISELEMDLNEHKIVVDTLKQVDDNQRCFRMIGGVLCERTVKEVLPELQTNCEQLPKVIAAISEQLAKKGSEINDYIELHNIKIQKNDDIQSKEEQPAGKSNVLVAE